MRKLFLLLITFSISLPAVQLRIINGTQVSDSDEQWRAIASLRYYYDYHYEVHYCGGTLIAPTWIVTAAHCIEAHVPTAVALGSYDILAMTPYSVKNSYIHPDYNNPVRDNDIALVELNSAVSGITPMVLDRNHWLDADTPTRVAGWGDTDPSLIVTSYPSHLMEVLVPIVDFTMCNCAYFDSLTNNMICAGYMEGNYDSCQGDSGGPLIINENGRVTQLGIVSFGMECAEAGYPGVYTKVQNYIPWIESYTGPLPDHSSVNAAMPAILFYLMH